MGERKEEGMGEKEGKEKRGRKREGVSEYGGHIVKLYGYATLSWQQ